MKSSLLFAIVFIVQHQVYSQNVGVGVTNPAHKLDVNGDINLSGALLANGQAGSKDQVLTSTGSGGLVWMDLSQFKQFETFSSVGPGTWTVPAGITKILVEVWGGGGGGSCQGGGGGGGYICGYFTVTPGSTVTYVVGDNGVGTNCVGTAANHGETSTAIVNGITIRGLGGQGSYYYGSGYFLGRGGAFSISPTTFRNWRGMAGEDGSPNEVTYLQPSSAVYWQQIKGGDGGNGANTSNTKSYGGMIQLNGTTVLKYVTGGNSKAPGGGGNGNSDHSTSYYGSSGADGLVIINY